MVRGREVCGSVLQRGCHVGLLVVVGLKLICLWVCLGLLGLFVMVVLEVTGLFLV